MCYHNYTSHPGCGHLSESPSHPWTLCAPALDRLSALRGPSSPPLVPLQFTPATGLPKRQSTISRLRKGFIERAAASMKEGGRRSVSDPAPGFSFSRSSTMSNISTADTGPSWTDAEIKAVKCAVPKARGVVGGSGLGTVCQECRVWIERMRDMILGFDGGKGVRGTGAYEEFLRARGVGDVRVFAEGVRGRGEDVRELVGEREGI
ncbi:hypothetical protein EJ04DRAFT_555904 [Polyplosphaeria fusca]|uniref:Uncharacterized protein n=1 Tax=Polyplosphaeria fusca TaxID=682080 RepID=A0A9P4UZ14_9PLEO|nr:hypothetical protein EJ04DRAFT_555904 [Polyplosphaeria fusca]